MIGVPFLDLKHGQCKFALGSIDDPPALFCGEASATGSPYCAAHHAICYPPRAKKERGGLFATVRLQSRQNGGSTGGLMALVQNNIK